MREKIVKVILADESIILLKGMCLFFETEPYIEVCGTANNGLILEELIRAKHPDIVICNPLLPIKDGLVVMKEQLRKKNKLKWIVLEREVNIMHYIECIEKGAKGYLTYQSTYTEVAHAIFETERGEYYICQQALPAVTKQFVSSYTSTHTATISRLFTEKQRKIIHLTCLGFTNKQQGDELGLDPRTIEKHIQIIFKKAKVNNRASLVRFAFLNGIENLAAFFGALLLFALDDESLTYAIPDFLSSCSFV